MKILGHRGAKAEKPENTLLGIKYAFECGVDGIEIDIHQSLDHQLVVIHDSTVDRTTNGSGPVDQMPFAELRILDAGEGEKIPTLVEVLDLMRLYPKKTLFIEIKANGVEDNLLTILENYHDIPLVIKSFNHRILKKIKEKKSNIPLAPLIYGLPVDPVSLVQAVGGEMLSISLMTIDELLVRDLHHAGLKVCGWNCNEKNLFSVYEKMGMDWIGTDIPSTICNLRG